MLIRAFMFVSLSLLGGTALARPQVEPPTHFLSSELTVVAVAKALAREGEARIVWSTETALRGEAPAQFTTRIAAPQAAQIGIGQTYIVGYTAHRRSRMPKGFHLHPDGPAVMFGAGAEPAVYPDHPVLRAWLAQDYQERDDADSRAAMLDGIEHPDGQIQQFFAAEIATRPALHKGWSRKQLARIRAVATDHDVLPAARELLFSAARDSAPAMGKDWWKALAWDVIRNEPLRIDPLRSNAELVMEALRLAREHPRELAVRDLARWTHADNPALAEAALLVLRARNDDSESSVLATARASAFLPQATREFLADHAHRLGVLKQRTKQ